MRQLLSSIYLPPALLPAGLQPRAYVPQIALPAFTFVFTFMFFSFLASVDSNDSSNSLVAVLGAPHGATSPYFRFHIHARSPFSLQLSPAIRPAIFANRV